MSDWLIAGASTLVGGALLGKGGLMHRAGLQAEDGAGGVCV